MNEYCIVMDRKVETLVKLVNEKLKDGWGWTVGGDLIYVADYPIDIMSGKLRVKVSHGPMYMQAMIKYEDAI